MQLTYKFRLRDKHVVELNRQARAVSFVWNYCNDAQRYAVQHDHKWLSWHDLQKLTAGSSKDLDLHAHTIQQVCQTYDRSRRAKKKAWLRYRGRKSLGWVPFNRGHVRFDGGVFVFRGVSYEPMHMRDIPEGATLGASSFNQDSRGRWYLNVLINVDTADHVPNTCVGIDLGLKDLATLSTGAKIEMPSFYRGSEHRLATAQRARKTKRMRAVHAKVANRRKDYLHKASAKIAKEFGLIVIGDVSPSKISRTIMAKSVLDAGWSDLKRMLTYKSIRNGGSTLEVSERLSTQTCSACGSLPPSRPRGIAGLSKRVWQCDVCEAFHDRDVNAARNILRSGLATLIGGTPASRPGSSQTKRAPSGQLRAPEYL